MSHKEDSNNPGRPLVTSLPTPQQLRFHLGLLWTLSQQALQGGRRARVPHRFPPLLSRPPQSAKKIQRCHFTSTDTRLLAVGFSFFKKNYVVDKLEETLRQVVLNGSYCGSLKYEPTENDRDAYCIHKHRLPASETKLWLRLGKGTIQREDRSCNNKHHTGRAALK